MPRREDLRSVMVIGSGPIVIGQACEFDYSGTQACRVLRAEGLRVVLVNSNPATIMTDPEFADATYVEPITPEFVEKIIARERPDALLADPRRPDRAQQRDGAARDRRPREVRRRADRRRRRGHRAGENREMFKEIVAQIDAAGLAAESARSAICHSMDDCLAAVDDLGYPVVVRPSFTMGGAGSGIAYDEADLHRIAGAGLAASPTTEVLLEESIIGWKEYELELMRDDKDNVVVVCSIENLDPMGVHTGDSITVAPALTLTDREYQHMRDVGIAIIRAVGVDTGGCNIQFAINPDDGRMIVIEMNPRVSRSSRPGLEGDRLPDRQDRREARHRLHARRDPQRHHPGDPGLLRADARLRRGEGAAVRLREVPPGRSHAHHDDEERRRGDGHRAQLHRGAAEGAAFAREGRRRSRGPARRPTSTSRRCSSRGRVPHDGRLARGAAGAVGRCHGRAAARGHQHRPVVPRPDRCCINEIGRRPRAPRPSSTPELLRLAKRHGFSDRQIGADAWAARGRASAACATRSGCVRSTRRSTPAPRSSRRSTPYHYSSYDEETEVEPRDQPAVIILGCGPNRIGQGIEFDYSCVHAASRCATSGYETVMVNCNPETVSTDYDTSDRLYFEPLTLGGRARGRTTPSCSAGPVAGVIVQLGGQTPLGLAQTLKDAGVPIVGTSPEAIHLAEERGAFGRVLADAGLPAPAHGTATTLRRGRRDRRRHRLPGAGAAVVRARWSRHGDRLRRGDAARLHRAGHARSAPSTRCWSTASSTTRSRSTSTRCSTATSSTSAASWSTSRRPASTPATPRARCRRSPWATPRSSASVVPPRRSPRGVGVRGPAQRPVRARWRRALRPRGQPARVAHGAVRRRRRPPSRWRRPRRAS